MSLEQSRFVNRSDHSATELTDTSMTKKTIPRYLGIEDCFHDYGVPTRSKNRKRRGSNYSICPVDFDMNPNTTLQASNLSLHQESASTTVTGGELNRGGTVLTPNWPSTS